MVKQLAASLALVLLSALTALGRDGLLDRVIIVAGETYKYQVYVPAEWSSKQNWPVILFLHGAGERGGDGMLPTQVGIGTAIRRDRSRVPAVVVFSGA